MDFSWQSVMVLMIKTVLQCTIYYYLPSYDTDTVKSTNLDLHNQLIQLMHIHASFFICTKNGADYFIRPESWHIGLFTFFLLEKLDMVENAGWQDHFISCNQFQKLWSLVLYDFWYNIFIYLSSVTSLSWAGWQWIQSLLQELWVQGTNHTLIYND